VARVGAGNWTTLKVVILDDPTGTEGSGNDVLAHFFRFMNRRYSFFTVHETEKTEMQNYLSRFVKNE
jgi:hypothetical protein